MGLATIDPHGHKVQTIWTQSGRIFIKANENTTTRSFDTVEDLSKFQRELEHLSG